MPPIAFVAHPVLMVVHLVIGKTTLVCMHGNSRADIETDRPPSL